MWREKKQPVEMDLTTSWNVVTPGIPETKHSQCAICGKQGHNVDMQVVEAEFIGQHGELLPYGVYLSYCTQHSSGGTTWHTPDSRVHPECMKKYFKKCPCGHGWVKKAKK